MGRQDDPICASNRQTTSKKSKVDIEALHAWRCRILEHVAKHPGPSLGKSFIDTDIDSASENDIKREAVRFAMQAFISEDQWNQSGSLNFADEIRAAARKLAIHPAIIAGRLRREAADYRKHRTLIGQGEVKVLFS